MRLRTLIFLSCLLAASRLAGAQTLDDAIRVLENKEYEKARVMLEKLATQGNTEAEFRLGEMYLRPIGIPRNKQRGIALYELAAGKGHAQAQYLLSMELVKGEAIPQDKTRAMGLLRTSAKLKNTDAQYALCMELSTEGGKFYDLDEGHAWCETASAKKHKQQSDAERRAKDALKKILAKGGPQAVEIAKARAIRYKKAY